jgi:hypothetical protein
MSYFGRGSIRSIVDNQGCNDFDPEIDYSFLNPTDDEFFEQEELLDLWGRYEGTCPHLSLDFTGCFKRN